MKTEEDINEVCDRIQERKKREFFKWWCRDMGRKARALFEKQEREKDKKEKGLIPAATALLAMALLLVGCGINPMEGDYGVVKWVPEEKDCMVYRRATPTRYDRVPGKCQGRGHDVEVFGTWRY